MDTETRTERYRKVAEGELQRGSPREPVLDQAIRTAAEKDADLTSQYAELRAGDMLAAEREREQAEERLRKAAMENDDARPTVLSRTLLLIAVIAIVVVVGMYLSSR
ncbi:MAG TPA: hypothetical protein VK968_16785 [Roseimicrobium sp.]|nr:hypothetical protein [Roseimicrobium sp.]